MRKKKRKMKSINSSAKSKPPVTAAVAHRSAVITGAPGTTTDARATAVAEAATLLGASEMPLANPRTGTAPASAHGTTSSASRSSPPTRKQPEQNNFDLLATAASQSQPSTPAKAHGFGTAASTSTGNAAAKASPEPVPAGPSVIINEALSGTSATVDASRANLGTTTHPAPDTDSGPDNDDEYAKFVRSLCQFPVLGPDDDLASLISRGGGGGVGGGIGAPTDDEDDGGSYQLQSDDDDDEDDDDELVGIILGRDDDNSLADEEDSDGNEARRIDHKALESGATGSTKRRSPRAATVDKDGDAAKSSDISTPKNEATTRSLNLYSEGAQSPVSIDNNLNIMAEIEAELSMLMEEDMDAAVSTLLGGHIGPSLTGSVSSSSNANSGQIGSGAAAKTKAPVANASPTTSKDQSCSNAPSHPSLPALSVDGKAQSTPLGASIASGGDSVSVSNPPQTPKAKAQLPTSAQIIELRSLMSSHYQLLLQQSVLAVRSANLYRHQKGGDCGLASGRAYALPSTVDAAAALVSAKKGRSTQETARGDDPVLEPSVFFFGGESAEDLAEILDGAVGMLQDLDENRKDGIRNALQLEVSRRRNPPACKQVKKKGAGLPSAACSSSAERFVATVEEEEEEHGASDDSNEENLGPRRLTRSAFQQRLKAREGFAAQGQESNQSWSHTNDLPISTAFDVRGLSRLDSSFASIDSSVDAASARRSYAPRPLTEAAEVNVLEPPDNGDACEMLLQQAGAHYNKEMIPGRTDPSELLSYPQELLGPKFKTPMSKPLQVLVRKNRSQFTSAEDNLVLRGVNLYGEKEWLMLSDRFLPDRSVSAISQRYSRLCLLIYRAAGVKIGPNGDLDPPPKHPNGAEDFDTEAISKIPPVEPPARFNVHRWSLDEDITLLKAVPVMGYMWAEIGNRLVKHRDRGHLRKRYQVLERRVKATVKREKKMPIETLKEPKGKSGVKSSSAKRPAPTMPTASTKSTNTATAANKKTKASKASLPNAPVSSGVAPLPYGGYPPPHEPYAAYYYYPRVPTDGSAPPTAPQSVHTGNTGEYPPESYPYPYPYPYGYYYPEGGYAPPEGYDYNSVPPHSGVNRAVTKPIKLVSASSAPNSVEARHPGAYFHAQSQKTKESRSQVGTFDPTTKQPSGVQNSPSVEACKPSKIQMGPFAPDNVPFTPNGLTQDSQPDESTRLGLEGILNDNEWSQMSRVKQMIESGEGGAVRPRGIALERLPSIQGSDQDASGLSVLNSGDESEAIKGGAVGKKATSGSIMASVLERANSRSVVSKHASSSSTGCKRESAAMERQHSLESAAFAVNSTPTKGGASSLHAPLTPMTYGASGRELSTIPETPGEIGALVASLRSPPKGSPMKSLPIGDATLMMRSPGGGMINMDGFEISNFSTGGDGLSRLAMTASGFGTNSLMETDLEAISALNALSNPPTPHVSAPNTPQKPPVAKASSKMAPVQGDSGISLFAKAVGQLAEKDTARASKSKKRRLG
mmetsp:Transcript_27904/g.56468  ORF Transcript_27904/g.56468 Transcript_27904/m.56468 type:complete len:1493 (-) Transcript_27904:2915-7393(-)